MNTETIETRTEEEIKSNDIRRFSEEINSSSIELINAIKVLEKDDLKEDVRANFEATKLY